MRRASTSSAVSAHSRSRAQRTCAATSGAPGASGSSSAGSSRAGASSSSASLPWKRARWRALAGASDGWSRSSRSHHGVRIGGAGQRHGRALERPQAEVAAQPLERVERDAPERRELAARDREHAVRAALEHGLAARGGRLALALRQHAHAREAREDAVALHDAGLDRGARLAHDLLDVGVRDLERARVALVGLVGRADEQRALPGIRELHAPALERRRQRGAPRARPGARPGARPWRSAASAARRDRPCAAARRPTAPSR